MTGLDHKRASLETREKFAATKDKAQKILADVHDNGFVGRYCGRLAYKFSISQSVKGGRA